MAGAMGLLRPTTPLFGGRDWGDWELTGGGPFKRRPVLGLTLRVVGGKAVLRPGWNPKSKWIYTKHLAGEVWLPAPGTGEPRRSWSFTWAPDGLHSGMVYRDQADAALATLAQLLRDWQADPASVLARSVDHCCVCGRVLTDPPSRGRGVGPECVRHFPERLAVLMAWTAEAVAAAR
jgi:hypothetical protein